jgi:Protein of unknown function (DUF3892)
MAEYRISGVWKEEDGDITDYAFHAFNPQTGRFSLPTKKSKAEAIALLDAGHSAKTIVWNYTYATWYKGEDVYVAGSGANRYLKSKPDDKISDNLGHLPRWNGVIE